MGVLKGKMVAAELHIRVVRVGPLQDEVAICLPAGATLADALREAVVDVGIAQYGVWGKVRPLTYALRDGDRVECYQPLLIDPKVVRRTKAANNRRR
ncbi:MAG: RnfH family protein [Betaproteobacteria bacterium]|nr:RnfH family protein [Betaproteobacteria bacterium]